jgi:hypothetical protein
MGKTWTLQTLLTSLLYKYKTKIIRYLKFGNARVRATESYGEWLFSWRSEKLNFRWNATNFVLAVAIVGSIKLVFFYFSVKFFIKFWIKKYYSIFIMNNDTMNNVR